MTEPVKRKKHHSSFQIIVFWFAAAIAAGTVLLWLPISSATGSFTPILKAMFTATSAVCVTGLVVVDTATHWSGFGHAVIIILIQAGGMGVFTIALAISLLSGKRIGLMQRSTMQEAIQAPAVGGIVKLTGFIIKATILFELAGALALSPIFIKEFGFFKGIWNALFHSISAFCNAGFDLMGSKSNFSSLTDYASSATVSLTITFLIIIGGIGFITWDDLKTNKFHFKKYRMQTKVVLITTGLLIILPASYLFFFEFAEMPIKERILVSLFQSVTLRTAGFNTVDFKILSDSAIALFIPIMMVGGSPGSTAGGIKTTTLVVLLAAAFASFRKREAPELFKRRVSNETIMNAASIMIMYAVLFYFSALIISYTERLPMLTCMFETASAIGTVGLSLGITPSLGASSQLILIFLMFFGRAGGLTIIFAATSTVSTGGAKFPLEKITVG